MAAAFRYAEDGGHSAEMTMLRYLDRFGAEATFGRAALRAKEVRIMTLAENVVNAYRDRRASSDWAKWAQDNPHEAELLGMATKAANNG